MLRIAITGAPGSRKSTVCRNVLQQLACTYGGMTCADIREKGVSFGFEISDIATGRHGILAHKKGAGPRGRSYHVDLEDLNNIGAAAITNAVSSDLIVINNFYSLQREQRT